MTGSPIEGRPIMRCDAPYARTETREQGGLARFEITFVDASGSTAQLYSENTQAAAAGAATKLTDDALAAARNHADWQ